MYSFADRLKNVVNQIEQTGTSLQQRAIGQGGLPGTNPQPSSSTTKDGTGARPTSPSISTSTKPTLSTSPTSPTDIKVSDKETSPTRATATAAYASTSLLAENALSGLRKSFQFGRTSLENTKSSQSATGSPGTGSGPQELKDINPTSPPAASSSRPTSRPSSPARFLGPVASHFAVGSETSSVSGTPQLPRSPIPQSNLFPPKSPLPTSQRALLPPPDPNDPATYPLPPSPPLTASEPVLAPSPLLYADPLGASPMLAADDPAEPPALGLADVKEAVVETEQEVSEPVEGKVESNGIERISGESIRSLENGKPPESAPPEKRLEDMERRYEDLSQRFTTVSTQKQNANKILRELTPLEGGVEDSEALEGWVRMMKGKVEMITEEMKRLQNKITLQDSRMEEIRDTHRLEGTSQTDLIAKLRSQLSTAETNLASKANELMTMGQLRADLAKAQTQAKEEEEKRTKAISLLKTVRMKLVKVEKEKEEIERDRAEERAERTRAAEEAEKVKAEREREVNALRKGFERELAGAKERYEKDVQSKKATWELDMITTKAAHAKELSGKSTKVTGLEAIVKELNISKQQQFEELQSRQAEVESSRGEMEALRTRTKELEFQLRESTERCALLEDQAASSRQDGRGRATLGVGLPDGARGSASPSPSRSNSYTGTSSAEVQRLLAEAESRSEAKLSDLRFKIRSLERDRNDTEEEWAAKLQERVSELEKLRRTILEKESEYAESLRTRQEKEAKINDQEEEKRALERQLIALRSQVDESKGDVSVAAEAEKAARDELSALQVQISTLQSQLEDSKSYSTHLKQTNKTLRDELRKVQSSVQLMERQRNPGVGYWSSANAGPAGSTAAVPTPTGSAIGSGSRDRSGIASPGEDGLGTPIKEQRRSFETTATTDREQGRGTGGSGTGTSSPAPSDRGRNQDEEEVNLEYLRNVILQFLEHKEMRPNLVRVLSVILRFTPQELRRLNAKLLS